MVIVDSCSNCSSFGACCAKVPVMLSVFFKIPSIDCWFLSDSKRVNRSVRVASLSTTSGALLSNSPNAPGLVGITGTPSGPSSSIGGAPLTAPSSWIFGGAVADALNGSGRALQNRCFFADFDTHPNEIRVLFPQFHIQHLPGRTPGKGNACPFGKTADSLREEYVILPGWAVTKAHDPDQQCTD